MLISEIDRDNITDEIVDRVLFKGLVDSGENAAFIYA